MNISKVFVALLLLVCFQLSAQGFPDYKGGYKITFDDSGQKYLRFISWGQAQTVTNFDSPQGVSETTFNLRRGRLLMLAQLDSKFLLVTHIGLNSLNASSMSPTGKGDGSQIFLHDMWAEYKLGDNHAAGLGLHYWNGISRLNNQSTLNMLTLDNNRQSWSTIGLTDQFARHLGVYFKGSLDRLQYRISINEALVNSLDMRDAAEVQGTAVYNGRATLGSKLAGKVYAGYFDFQLLDKESNFLPYKVGTYLGSKKVLNIGYGFFHHTNGAVTYNSGEYLGQNTSIQAVDIFLDHPVGNDNGAITAYATHQINNYGQNYLYSAYGTGNFTYGHLGYVFPGDPNGFRLQPYIAFGRHNYDAAMEARNVDKYGLNFYISGHHSKFTLEYSKDSFISDKRVLTIQAMIYL